MKGEISVTGTVNANRRNKNLTLKNNSFISSTSKINNTILDNAEHRNINIFMVTYNLLGYSDNCSMASGKVLNYHRDEVNDDANEIVANHKINKTNTTTTLSFEYKENIIRTKPTDNDTLDTEVERFRDFLVYF